MKRSMMVVFVAALLVLPVVQVAFADVLTVQTGQNYFNCGSIVSITGDASPDAVVLIEIQANSIQVYDAEEKANSTGGYEFKYTLPYDAKLGVYTVTATSGTLTSKTSFTVTSDSIGEIARQLIEAAEGSHTLAGGTIREIIALGYTVPAEADTAMTQGQEALTEATSLNAQGLNTASAEAAQRAMLHFRNALALSLEDAKGYEYNPSQQEVLTYRLEKLNDELNQVSELIADFAEDDANLPTLKALMESAASSLVLASIKIDEGNFNEAALALTSAQKDVQESIHLIKSNINYYRKNMVTQFANRLRERIDASSNDLEQLSSQIQTSYMHTATQRLGEANGLITQAENRLQEGLDEDAINSLDEAMNRFRLGLDELGDDDLSQGLMQLNMIRCQIQVQQGVAEMIRRRGQDASAVEAQIRGLQGLADEGMKRMRVGDYSGANSLFGDAAQGGQYYDSGPGGSGSGQSSGGAGKGSGGGN